MNRREFSFTLSDDVYIRYLSFASENQLKSALVQKNPVKMDIGAVYDMNPSEGKSSGKSFKVVERELVFDIDMTDYDDVRTCCKGADVCKKCWRFLAIACKILNHALVQHFGFKQLLWVFSGRRGIHCWVCDESARTLTPEERASIAEYLSLVEGGKLMTKKCTLDQRLAAYHPLVTEALNIIDAKLANGKTMFEQIVVEEQKLLETDKNWKMVIGLCNNTTMKQELEFIRDPTKKMTPAAKLEKMMKFCADYKGKHLSQLGVHFMEELKLQICYPRLDINVSRGMNHLLKSPFVIHPKTGRVCVPFDVKKVDSFDPKSVPTISQVISQLDDCGAGDGNVKCMAAGLLIMSQFVTHIPDASIM